MLPEKGKERNRLTWAGFPVASGDCESQSKEILRQTKPNFHQNGNAEGFFMGTSNRLSTEMQMEPILVLKPYVLCDRNIFFLLRMLFRVYLVTA